VSARRQVATNERLAVARASAVSDGSRRTKEVPNEARKPDCPHLQAVRLLALRDIEARHRASLIAAIERAELGTRIAETLDERFDRRFRAVARASRASRLRSCVTEAAVSSTIRSRMSSRATACATTAGGTPSTSLDRSERSRHVPAHAT
jgi:hypothetical protein